MILKNLSNIRISFKKRGFLPLILGKKALLEIGDRQFFIFKEQIDGYVKSGKIEVISDISRIKALTKKLDRDSVLASEDFEKDTMTDFDSTKHSKEPKTIKEFKPIGEQTKLVLGKFSELEEKFLESNEIVKKLKKEVYVQRSTIKQLKELHFENEDNIKLFSMISHKERRFYYDVPVTKTEYCDLVVCSRKLDCAYIKVATAPTGSNGEKLEIDILINGTSILENPVVIDSSWNDNELYKVNVKNNKLKLGDEVKMELTYTAGTSPNTLAGIVVNQHYLQIF